ncbi:MAG: hypothetical protein JWQ35_141 [Bacteriovoracaceae bacterium]|nr:hypothetical protein [Bacteriovoracaceae bacterium]
MLVRLLTFIIFITPVFLAAQNDPATPVEGALPDPEAAPALSPVEPESENLPVAKPEPEGATNSSTLQDDPARKASDLPEKGTEQPATNEGQPFHDPFSDQPAQAPESVAPADRFASPPVDQFAPPPPAPVSSPTPLPQEVQPQPPAEPPTAAPMPPEFAPPLKSFDFPEPEELKGPVSEDYLQARKMDAEIKKDTWNIGGAFGGGINMNRRDNQVDFEFSGGYRPREQLELGATIYYRFTKDALIGFLATGKWDFILRRSAASRIDFLPEVGLGWTLRIPPSTNKITEGRMPFRFGSEFLFYATPKFAITTHAAIETFLFSVDTHGNGTNFFRAGLPTQLILLLGTRFEF